MHMKKNDEKKKKISAQVFTSKDKKTQHNTAQHNTTGTLRIRMPSTNDLNRSLHLPIINICYDSHDRSPGLPGSSSSVPDVTVFGGVLDVARSKSYE